MAYQTSSLADLPPCPAIRSLPKIRRVGPQRGPPSGHSFPATRKAASGTESLKIRTFPNQHDVFWHELRSDQGPNVYPALLQLLHEFPDQLFWVGFADMRGLALQRVVDAHWIRDMSVLIRERCCGLISLVFVVRRFKIIDERLRVSSRFLFNFGRASCVVLSSHSHFLMTRKPAVRSALVRSSVARKHFSRV